MDGLSIAFHCRLDNAFDIPIGLIGFGRSNMYGMVGPAHVTGAGVGIGVHGHGFHAQAATGVNDATGNFAAVGNQYSFKHACCSLWLGVAHSSGSVGTQAGRRFSRKAPSPSWPSGDTPRAAMTSEVCASVCRALRRPSTSWLMSALVAAWACGPPARKWLTSSSTWLSSWPA